MRTVTRQWLVLILLWTVTITFLRHLWQPFRSKAVFVIESNPFSADRGIDTYDFTPTPSEAECARGDPFSQKKPIPNIVHFIILGPHHANLSFPVNLSISSALTVLEPTSLKLHHTEQLNPDDPYLKALLRDSRVQVVHHNLEGLASRMPASSQSAHLADVLRLQVLYDDGGIYLDTDVFVLNHFRALLNCPQDIVLGNEGGNRWGLCNAVIMARPKAKFIKTWLESYKNFKASEWNYHSVILPKAMSKETPNQICELAPHAFFWPTWTARHVRWMHQPLSYAEVKETEHILIQNSGSLFDGQLAYHAWNAVAKKRYLGSLNRTKLLQEDTRFNMMLRRFAS